MRSPFRLLGALLAGCLLASTSLVEATAGELKLKAQLVWGTDDTKPPAKDYKELEPALREKVRQLRWKNYFVVKTTTVAPAKEARKVELSDRCLLSARDLGNGQVEVTLFNPKGDKPTEPAVRPKLVAVENLKQGHACVIAGDSKDRWDDAWLVFITIGE